MLAVTAFIAKSDAQVVGIKTNLVQWATVSPNLGVEIGLGKQTTLDISAGFNPFKFSHDRQWRHWMVQPEFRWWTCERFNGHFLGAHLLGGGYAHAWYDQYNGEGYNTLVRSDANKNYWGLTKLAISFAYLF